MSTDFSIPPLRDLPPGRLAQRKEHLVRECARSDRRLPPFPPLRRDRSSARARKLVLVVAMIALLGAVLVTPALGLRGAILDLVGRSDVSFSDAPPAASVIRRDFEDMASGAPKGMDPRADARQARIVGTFDFGSGRRRVWAAPTMTGSFCYFFEGISGGCQSPEAAHDPLVIDGGFVLRPGTEAPAMDKLAGRIFDPAAVTLRVTFEDEKTIFLPFVYVSEPINAGFFAYKPTPAEERPGHRPAKILLLNAKGTTIAEETINWENEQRKIKQMLEISGQKQQHPRRPGGTQATVPTPERP